MRGTAASLAQWRLSSAVRLGAEAPLACADATTGYAGQIRVLAAGAGSSASVHAITGNPFAVRPDGVRCPQPALLAPNPASFPAACTASSM